MPRQVKRRGLGPICRALGVRWAAAALGVVTACSGFDVRMG